MNALHKIHADFYSHLTGKFFYFFFFGSAFNRCRMKYLRHLTGKGNHLKLPSGHLLFVSESTSFIRITAGVVDTIVKRLEQWASADLSIQDSSFPELAFPIWDRSGKCLPKSSNNLSRCLSLLLVFGNTLVHRKLLLTSSFQILLFLL